MFRNEPAPLGDNEGISRSTIRWIEFTDFAGVGLINNSAIRYPDQMQSISLNAASASAALGCSPAGWKAPDRWQENAVDVGFYLGQCLNGIGIGLSSVARSAAFNHAANHAIRRSGHHRRPIRYARCPSIIHAPAFVAPMASSLTKALGDECERRSIILNTTPIPELKSAPPSSPLPKSLTFGRATGSHRSFLSATSSCH